MTLLGPRNFPENLFLGLRVFEWVLLMAKGLSTQDVRHDSFRGERDPCRLRPPGNSEFFKGIPELSPLGRHAAGGSPPRPELLETAPTANGSLRAHPDAQMARHAAMRGRASLLYSSRSVESRLYRLSIRCRREARHKQLLELAFEAILLCPATQRRTPALP